MSNKTQLQTNNTQLASLIQTLQGKAAGGGGSSGGGAETCTVEIVADAPVSKTQNVSYINQDGEFDVYTPTGSQWMMGFTLTIRISSPLVFGSAIGVTENTGNVIKMSNACYYITGDTTITILG
jgi:hypothetical protein